MRLKLLGILLCLCSVTPIWGVAAYAQSASGTVGTTGTPSATFTASNLIAGSTVIAFVVMNNSTTTVSGGVSDGTHAFTQGPSCRQVGNPFTAVDIWYLKNVTGGNKPTVTATLSTSDLSVVYVAEVTGANTTAPFDVCATGAGNVGPNIVSSTLTTSTANEIMLCIAVDAGGVFNAPTAGAGWTSRQTSGTGNFDSNMATQGPVAVGGYTCTMTMFGGSTSNWEVSIIAIKGPVIAGAIPPRRWVIK